MKKFLVILCVLLTILCVYSFNTNKVKQDDTPVIETKQDLLDYDYDNFVVDKDKYQLKKVVVLSRHNIRSPLSTGDSLLNEVTNHEWYDWSSAASELSLRGGDLETQMGQYFRKYLVDNGLMVENWDPSNEEVRLYANSLQRTIATSNYFLTGLFPTSNLDVEYHMELGTMDPVFNPVLTFVNDKYADEMQKKALESIDLNGLNDNFALLEEVLDYSESNLAKSQAHLDASDAKFIYELNKEPRAQGSLNTANSAADALKLQFYEESDSLKAAFNHDITIEQWLDICEISDAYQEVLFTIDDVAINVANPLLLEISSELNNDDRIFTFLCGHDSNIGSVLTCIDVKDYELPKSLERKTPIGSALVFEVWQDKQTEQDFISLTLQYQSLSQLKNRPLLDLDNTPVKYHFSINGLDENSDGLYLLEDFNNRLSEKIVAYDELADKYN